MRNRIISHPPTASAANWVWLGCLVVLLCGAFVVAAKNRTTAGRTGVTTVEHYEK